MTYKIFRIYLFLNSAFIGSVLADTALPTPPDPTASAASVLSILLLCGLMGLLGQGCRVVVGMATMVTSKVVAPADNVDVFNLARLIFSLIVGFLAGLVSALVQWKASGSIAEINTSNFNAMFEFAIAGYIGTDVIEAFTVQFFEKNQKDNQASEKDVAPNSEAQLAAISDSVTDVHSMVSSIADTIGDSTSPLSKFKAKAPGIMSELISDFDLSDFQAAGILGNIGVECNGFTQMQEVNPVGGGIGGYGWAQWTGPRRKQYLAWCQNNQLDKDSDKANYGFMKNEFTTNYKRVITDLKKTQTVEDATTVVLKEYEGAGVPATGRRVNWANIALQAFKSEQA